MPQPKARRKPPHASAPVTLTLALALAQITAMARKDHIDGAGVAMLVGFAMLLALNQVVVKVSNGGFQPVFMAGLRSVLALGVLLLWMRLRGISPVGLQMGRYLWPGLLTGAFFSVEFTALYLALDMTTVVRSSILLYSMPLWLAIAAHFTIPDETLTPRRALGLALAMGGVVWVLLAGGDASGARSGDLKGDLLALLAAFCWAGLTLTLRLTHFSALRPEGQLLWQLGVSTVLLMIVAPFFGPFLRDLTAVHWAGLAFQSVAIASFGFVFWFWLIQQYPTSGVASFSFLTPVFGVVLGWLVLGEEITPALIGALGLVTFGLVLINRRKR